MVSPTDVVIVVGVGFAVGFVGLVTLSHVHVASHIKIVIRECKFPK